MSKLYSLSGYRAGSESKPTPYTVITDAVRVTVHKHAEDQLLSVSLLTDRLFLPCRWQQPPSRPFPSSLYACVQRRCPHHYRHNSIQMLFNDLTRVYSQIIRDLWIGLGPPGPRWCRDAQTADKHNITNWKLQVWTRSMVNKPARLTLGVEMTSLQNKHISGFCRRWTFF